MAGDSRWLDRRNYKPLRKANFGSTGFTMSVPVIAPVLYDVILRNTGTSALDKVYVALFTPDA